MPCGLFLIISIWQSLNLHHRIYFYSRHVILNIMQWLLCTETPLTLAAVSSRPGPLLLALVGGGALIDYRTRCGSTALHRASEKSSIEAVRTLLDLGASPNVRDAKGLTPLWTAVSAKASPMLCQALLHDYSIHGVQDAQGWHEVHQVCQSFFFLSNPFVMRSNNNMLNWHFHQTPLHLFTRSLTSTYFS